MNNETKAIELLHNRFSPRNFNNTMIPDEVLVSLFEAARISPSAFNDQPWSFFVATKNDMTEYEKMYSLLTDRNKAWVNQAPVIILVVARNTFAHNGSPNSYALYDTGGAVAHLTTQAASQGLYVHQMAGFNRELAAELFALPENYKAVTMLALGYLSDELNSTETIQKTIAERKRNAVESIVFTKTFGEKYYS